MSIKKRIFIVGSPRSGSTLLQNFLLNYSEFYSFPETHFFYPLYDTNRVARFFKIANRDKAKAIIAKLGTLLESDQEDLRQWLNSNSYSYNYWNKVFVELLDKAAEKNKKQYWIEKTPMHLHYAKYIESYIPDFHFIHIVRSGIDVVSSVYNYSNKHPDGWGYKRSIDVCIKRWKLDVLLAKKCISRQGHSFITYEDLVLNNKVKIKKLCDEIGIDYNPAFFSKVRVDSFEATVNKNEPWKLNVKSEVKNTNGELFEKLFNADQKAYIKSKIAQVDLSCFK